MNYVQEQLIIILGNKKLRLTIFLALSTYQKNRFKPFNIYVTKFIEISHEEISPAAQVKS